MTGWIGARKQDSLWGTPSRSGGGVRRGDDLLQISEFGLGALRDRRATTDARAPRDVTEVPWPEPERYGFVFGIEVLSEPAAPVAMAGAEAARIAACRQ